MSQVQVGTSHQDQRVVGYLTSTHLHAIEGTVQMISLSLTLSHSLSLSHTFSHSFTLSLSLSLTLSLTHTSTPLKVPFR